MTENRLRVLNPRYRECVEKMFEEAAFVSLVGVKLASVSPGNCTAVLELRPFHLQHLGRVHGGVIATLAGHSAAGAATTIVPEESAVVAAQFNMNLLRSVSGESLVCRAWVLKPGARVIFVEAEVFTVTGNREVLTAKVSYTMNTTAAP